LKRRVFALQGRPVAHRGPGGRIAVRRRHRLGVVLGLAGRVRQAAGKHHSGVEKAFVKNAKLFQAANIVLLLAAVAAAVFIGLNKGLSVWWIVLLLVLAGIMGLFVVFPIGGADMPVVISLLNAMTGLSAAAAGRR
jgi:NAD/NADP transhydrogenase beta subunit